MASEIPRAAQRPKTDEFAFFAKRPVKLLGGLMVRADGYAGRAPTIYEGPQVSSQIAVRCPVHFGPGFEGVSVARSQISDFSASLGPRSGAPLCTACVPQSTFNCGCSPAGILHPSFCSESLTADWLEVFNLGFLRVSRR